MANYKITEAAKEDLTKSTGMSVNHLLDEVTTLILAEFDLKTQFENRAELGQGKVERGLELLNKAKFGFSE